MAETEMKVAGWPADCVGGAGEVCAGNGNGAS